jgi:6-phosphogluconolactonase (cycloisomerase 2 family)
MPPRLVTTALLAVLLSIASSAGVARATGLYVSVGSNPVSPFPVNGDGSLAPVACSPTSNCSTGVSPEAMAVGPSGRFLYTANSGSGPNGGVSVYSIAPDASLTPAPCSPAINCSAPSPFGLAVTPSGRFLYVTNPAPTNTVSVFSIGADGTLTPVPCSPVANCNTGMDPAGVAVTPSERFLYVTNDGASSVSAFAIGANGSLTPIQCDPTTICATGSSPNGVKVSPSGRFLYTTNIGSDSISVFAIADDGTLSPVACNPASNCHTQNGPQDLAVTPSGRFLYATGDSTGAVSPFSINSDGSLAPIACSPASNCDAGTSTDGVAVSPSGRFLYAAQNTTTNGAVAVFAIGADGSLSRVPCNPASNCNTGPGSNFQSLAIQPDQGPTAALLATAAPAGSPSSFDASASSDSDGQVVRFDWDFGDGTVVADAGAKPLHTYAAPGSYTASVTVTDNAGCSSARVFTGQEVSCNGSGAAATATASVTVTPPLPTLSKVSQTARRWRKGKALPHAARKKRLPVGTTFRFSLNVPATVRLAFTTRAQGRRVKRKCVRPTRRNRRRPRCRRTVAAGTLKFAMNPGARKVRFQGRISRRKTLGPGRYKVTITATDSLGRRSAPRSLTFTIVKG